MGVGDVNRKSVVGVVAGFAGALAVNLALISANGLLIGPWIGLAFVIALSNCLVELYSPRGTDEFTIATTNALLCLAFGAWVIVTRGPLADRAQRLRRATSRGAPAPSASRRSPARGGGGSYS